MLLSAMEPARSGLGCEELNVRRRIRLHDSLTPLVYPASVTQIAGGRMLIVDNHGSTLLVADVPRGSVAVADSPTVGLIDSVITAARRTAYRPDIVLLSLEEYRVLAGGVTPEIERIFLRPRFISVASGPGDHVSVLTVTNIPSVQPGREGFVWISVVGVLTYSTDSIRPLSYVNLEVSGTECPQSIALVQMPDSTFWVPTFDFTSYGRGRYDGLPLIAAYGASGERTGGVVNAPESWSRACRMTALTNALVALTDKMCLTLDRASETLCLFDLATGQVDSINIEPSIQSGVGKSGRFEYMHLSGGAQHTIEYVIRDNGSTPPRMQLKRLKLTEGEQGSWSAECVGRSEWTETVLFGPGATSQRAAAPTPLENSRLAFENGAWYVVSPLER